MLPQATDVCMSVRQQRDLIVTALQGHQDNEIREGRTPIRKGGGWIAENSKAHTILLLTRRAKRPNAEYFEARQSEALTDTPSNVPQWERTVVYKPSISETGQATRI
jgi:hypothetical protein